MENIEFEAMVRKVESVDRKTEDVDTHIQRTLLKQNDGPWKANVEGPQGALIGLKPGSYVTVKIVNPQTTISEASKK